MHAAEDRSAVPRAARLCTLLAWLAALAIPLVWPLVRRLYPLPPPRPPQDGLAGVLHVLDSLAEGARGELVLMVVAGCWLLCLGAAWAAGRMVSRQRGGLPRRRAHRVAAIVATLLLALPLVVQAAPSTTRTGDTMDSEPTPFESARRAIAGGDVRQALTLLPRVDTGERDVLGRTLLHEAVHQGGDLALLKALLDAGVPVDARDHDGATALHRALQRHQQAEDGPRVQAVAGLLLARGARLAPEPPRAGPDAPSLLATLLMGSVDPALLRLLLQHGLALPDDAVLKTVSAAESPRQVDAALVVVQQAPPAVLRHRDEQGRTAVHAAAAAARRMPLLELLARRGADLQQPDRKGTTPFAEAALGNNIAALQWLAVRHAVAMTADADGRTPLHAAACEPRAEILQWLLHQGADLQARDQRGRRALDIAIDTHRFATRPAAERLALARLLGGGEADVARARLADQPLLRAIHDRDQARVTQLLAQGADTNVPDEWGHGPLHYALTGASTLPNAPAERAFAQWLLPRLLRHGADPYRLHDVWNGTDYVDDARRLRVSDLLSREMRAAGVAERVAAGRR